MATFVCRITMNLRTTAYAPPPHQSNSRYYSTASSSIVLSTFRPVARETERGYDTYGIMSTRIEEGKNVTASANDGFDGYARGSSHTDR
jgi:hypothetical protein